MNHRIPKTLLVAMLATLLSSTAAFAQQPATGDATTTPPVDTRDHDRGFDDWGLLGLLGLLGLVPRKRRDVVVDNTRPSTNPAR